MFRAVLCERDIARRFRHCECCVFGSRLNRLYIIGIVARTGNPRILERQQPSVSLGHRELRGLLSRRRVHKVLLQVRTRSLGFAHVEMLLHAFVAGLLPPVVLVIKPVL